MQNTIADFYNDKILTLESEIKKIRRYITYLYLLRLFTFISFASFLIIFFLHRDDYLYLILSLTSLVLFLCAVRLDLKYDHKEKFLSSKLQINKNEVMFLEHQYHERETGDEYNYLNPHLAADFDVFGKGSLFQYLNRTSTKIGKAIFAKRLCQSQMDENLIRERQLAIEELAGKNDFIQDFQTHGMFFTENDNESANLHSWLNQPAEKNNFLRLLCIVVPLFNAVWIALIVFGVFTLNSIALIVFLNIFIISLNFKKIQKAHSLLGKTAKTFEKYTALIKMVEETEFKSAYLSSVRQQLFHNGNKAGDSLSSLFKLLNKFDLRYNIIVSFVLNTLLLFDIQVYYRLIKWKEKNKDLVFLWLDALSEVDVLIGFSTFAFNNQKSVCYPKISDNEFEIRAMAMGHPLLHSSVRVCNDFHISGTPAVMIITGANMAGKSTFLRTLSVNLILAMNGAPVCAKDFLFKPCEILSSIKIQDSLTNNESYFYAELLRLKDIITHAKANPGTLIILDEILRGTNTKDKHLGSLGLLEKLISINSVVIIATHDLAIAELEKDYPEVVANHCFEVELMNDQLIFDYKFKKGISQKLNASFLMRKMEIIN